MLNVSRVLAIAVIAAVVFARPAAATPCDITLGEQGRVIEIVDGDTVVLNTGLEIRLVGVQAPKLPLGRPGFVPWPLADEAKSFLSNLVLGRELTLSYGGRDRDRYDRALAHLHLPDGTWVQEALLRAGMARVCSFADNRTCVDELLQFERAGRAAGHGMWSDPWYRVRSGPDTFNLIDSFQVVEETVVSAAIVRRRAFLNFGEDYRTDFTVTIAPKDLKLFEAAGIDLAALSGRTVRVRGWIQAYNGPNIVLTHPEQLEIIGP